MTDPLPESLDYVSDSCGGSWDAGSRTWSWQVGDLAAGGRIACELTTRVLSLDRGMITNRVTIGSDGTDPHPGDETSEVTVEVKEPGIPAATPWGLAVLAALLGLTGLALLRRHGS